uniref:Uncharacterized protein n=1 Tax=Romanomermis culicivorax TaxID=13658 RepID=A0A915JVZ9_ROMCU
MVEKPRSKRQKVDPLEENIVSIEREKLELEKEKLNLEKEKFEFEKSKFAVEQHLIEAKTKYFLLKCEKHGNELPSYHTM